MDPKILLSIALNALKQIEALSADGDSSSHLHSPEFCIRCVAAKAIEKCES